MQDNIAGILNSLQLQATIIVDTIESDGKKYLDVKMEGEDLSVLIGYHGRTLDALRTVLMMMVPRSEDGTTMGVLLDVNNYHAKREDTVRKMTLSAIDQVKLTTQPMELTPMKPADRRVVHMVVKEDETLETESIGEGEERRVVIKLKNN